MSLMFLVLVLFDGVRSAEPPTVVGRMPLMTSSAFSEVRRVPVFGFSAASFCAVVFFSCTHVSSLSCQPPDRLLYELETVATLTLLDGQSHLASATGPFR